MFKRYLPIAIATVVVALVSASPSFAVAAGFGVETFAMPLTEAGGAPATQAGSHPYAMTTSFVFDNHYSQTYQEDNSGNGLLPNDNPKDIEVNLPPGVIVNPDATPTRCTEVELDRSSEGEAECPPSSAVGVLSVDLGDFLGELNAPVYNMVAPPGVPAELGSVPGGVGLVVHVIGKLRTGSDYGISGAVANLTQYQSVYGATLTLWGDPSAESHDVERGPCAEGSNGDQEYEKQHGPCKLEERVEKPLLTLPSSCPGTPLQATMSADSWQEPGVFPSVAPFNGAVVGGCSALQFSPTIIVRPEKTVADSPAGLDVDLHVPQPERVEGLAEANLQDATVALPRGVTINPSEANGLVGCPAEKFGLTSAPGTLPITTTPGPAECPETSKIGSVEVDTPLLERPLTGGVYLAQQGNAGAAQGTNPFNSLLALYLVAEGSGVVIKLAGEVKVEPGGQLVTTFLNNPQLPFEDFKLDFFGGQRAPLVTPAQCGSYAPETSLTPWSGTGAVSVPSSFAITEGCAGSGGFAPGFSAGSVDSEAGASSPFTLTLTRNDGEQTLGSVATSLPPGLLGMISTVTQCPEAQAEVGDCPGSSQIGHVTSVAGVGSDPIVLPEAGRREDPVYLTGPYGGGPFGLAIVVHPEAGPFNLEEGHPVVVRAGIHVDEHTAQVSVDSTSIPTALQNIPLDVRSVNVLIDRAGFMLNPTGCEAGAVTSTIASSAGAAAAVSTPFQATNCATMPFGPRFAVSTSAKTSKADGASLRVKIVPPAEGPQSSSSGSGPEEANIKYVKVELPKQLPSRLTTLQEACTAEQFDSNPAGCPSASMVGVAVAHTPILSNPLTGPAYFVSHGNEAFPQLIIVLQGEGVAVDLVGDTFISKAGITSSTFSSVPDVPISSFELILPEQSNSALTTLKPGITKLCAEALIMPTEIVGQNGARSTQNTHIEVEGCPDALYVISHRVSKDAAWVTVDVPSAGRLVATGMGLSKASKISRGATALTVKLSLTKGQAAFLAKHKGRKLRATVDLRFTPKAGSRLKTTTTVLIGPVPQKRRNNR
jgi:hypothetical protein